MRKKFGLRTWNFKRVRVWTGGGKTEGCGQKSVVGGQSTEVKIKRLDKDDIKTHIRPVETLSPTKARSNLTYWLKAAAGGKDVGILYGDQVIALRPVTVESTDYAMREYGASEVEVRNLSKKLDEEIQKNRQAGKLKSFTGNIEALLAD